MLLVNDRCFPSMANTVCKEERSSFSWDFPATRASSCWPTTDPIDVQTGDEVWEHDRLFWVKNDRNTGKRRKTIIGFESFHSKTEQTRSETIFVRSNLQIEFDLMSLAKWPTCTWHQNDLWTNQFACTPTTRRATIWNIFPNLPFRSSWWVAKRLGVAGYPISLRSSSSYRSRKSDNNEKKGFWWNCVWLLIYFPQHLFGSFKWLSTDMVVINSGCNLLKEKTNTCQPAKCCVIY